MRLVGVGERLDGVGERLRDTGRLPFTPLKCVGFPHGPDVMRLVGVGERLDERLDGVGERLRDTGARIRKSIGFRRKDERVSAIC